MSGPQILTMPRYDETVAHLKKILAEVEAGEHGTEPRMVVVIEQDSGTTRVFGPGMQNATISYAYHMLGKAMRQLE